MNWRNFVPDFVTANLFGKPCHANCYQNSTRVKPIKMKPSKRHEPACMVAHEMAGKMANIIGHCDLLSEILKSNAEASRRVNIIRDIAKTSVAELREHERRAQAG